MNLDAIPIVRLSSVSQRFAGHAVLDRLDWPGKTCQSRRSSTA